MLLRKQFNPFGRSKWTRARSVSDAPQRICLANRVLTDPTLFAEGHGNVARWCSDLLSKKNPSELVRLDYAVVEASGLVRPQSGGKRSETKRYIISNYPLA